MQPGELSPAPTPLYSGLAQVGQTITALPREWGPGRVDLAYQWFRGHEAIPGVTKVKYVATAADEGSRLRVQVTGSRHGYRPASRMSGFTYAIVPGDLEPGSPRITGEPVEGRTLTAHGGDCGPGKVALSYDWFRDGLLITKTTGASYHLGRIDVG